MTFEQWLKQHKADNPEGWEEWLRDAYDAGRQHGYNEGFNDAIKLGMKDE